MKNWPYYILFIFIPVTVWFVVAIRKPNPNIITNPGWEHGVVVCGESVTVNHGHERDHEFAELLDLADRFCPKK